MSTSSKILPFEATHPGTLIRDEIEVRSGLTQKELAKELGVKPSFLNEVIKGKRPVTADLAVLLEKILNIPADYWLKFQSQYELDKARIKEKNIRRLKNIETWKSIKRYVPIDFFKKKGYITDNLERDIETIKSIYAVKNTKELESKYKQYKFAFYGDQEQNKKNILAWISLAFHEANQQKAGEFKFENIPGIHIKLNDVFYQSIYTPEKVNETLAQYGIKLVLIHTPEEIPVNGFSFWSGENPAIALALKKQFKKDDLAFYLFHEIAHIDLHLRNNKNRDFLDLTNQKFYNTEDKEALRYVQEKFHSYKI